jgi:hypothetical protein
MTGVNEMNAVMREQARIREAIVKDCHKITLHGHEHGKSEPYTEVIWVKLADVLKVLDGSTLRHDSIGYSPWPNKGDIFYRINAQGKIIEAPWTDSPKQQSFLHYGNVFKTMEQAEEVKEKIAAIFSDETVFWRAHDARSKGNA